MWNAPQGVSMSRSDSRLTSDSWRLRYSIRSAMVPIFSLCSAANSSRSGMRAMVPSSRMISHSTAAGVRPARRARSQHASVWPARTSTPPGCAMSGNTCPAWTMSCAVAFSPEATLMVSARSCAGMPVAMPSAASIGPVKLGPGRGRFGDRHADRAAPVARQEVDLLGRDELRGEHQVALVLAVLVVDQDDDLAGLDRGDDLGDRADGGGFAAHGPILRPYSWESVSA